MRAPRFLFILVMAILLALGTTTVGRVSANPGEGAVKLHDGATEPEPVTLDDPKVCTFHVHALGFEPEQVMSWWIDQQPPTGTANVIASESLTVDANGGAATTVRHLPNGHYKLYWQIAGGSTKHKVFKVDCETPEQGTLEVQKFNDLDGDGARDDGEPALAGWTFTVDDNDGRTRQLTTGEDGTDFVALAAGTYTVTETTQIGWVNTMPGDGDKDVTVVEGQTATAVFGNYRILALKLTSMCSDDPSETREWRVRNPNPVDVPFTWELYPDVQTGDGVALANSDVFFTTDTIEGPNTTTIHWNGGETVKASGGAQCEPRPETGSLKVCKFNDLDGDATRDDGEGMLAGWSFDVGRAIIGLSVLPEPIRMTTGENGCDVEESLAPGDYTVTEIAQVGWENTTPGGGETGVTIVAGQQAEVTFGNTAIAPLTLTSMCSDDPSETREWRVRNPNPFDVPFTWEVYGTGQTGSGTALANDDVFFATTTVAGPNTTKIYWNGGQTVKASGGAQCEPQPKTGTLRVFKYNDENDDGQRDEGEAGLSGWHFTVTPFGEVSVSTSLSLTTGASPLGLGTLEVPAGRYEVCEDSQLPARWSNTDPGDGLCKTVTVYAGEQSDEVSFGNHYTPVTPSHGTLQVTKYNDTDRDGSRDGNEPGLVGWVFSVYHGTTLVTTLTTDASGVAATSLLPDTYIVTEVAQTGWTNTDPGGAAPTKTASVTAGQLTGIIFGNAVVIIPPTTQTQLVITKYADTDRDGTRDTGEGVLAGFTFTIRDSTGTVVNTVVSGADGTVTLTGLALGTYTITEEARTGWVNTDPGTAASARKSVTFTSSATSLTAVFGNAPIQLPSTATADDASAFLAITLLVLMGLAIPFLVRRRVLAL